MDKIYDVIILGAGPAGLAAGLYAGRSRLSALIIEKEGDGGQIAATDQIENYPGAMPEGESGSALAARMSAQAERFGAERISDTIVKAELEGPVKKLTGTAGEYLGKTVIIAAGAVPRPLGCPGEQELTGRGVSYCATCDGAFFQGLPVYVAGGGDAAVEEAIYLTRFARKVTVIHRRDRLRAAKAIQEKAFADPKIEFLWDSTVEALEGDGVLERMRLKNVKTGEETCIEADPSEGLFGLFVFIGLLPATELFGGSLELENGYIRTDERMRTGIPGVFAAGDIRVKSLRQVVTAVADGAIAAVEAGRFLEERE
ncbi:MAG: thioredoxin-disulfide reductase [Bacillota bacterium]|nr:thioredoxin-disulfide reductase [Bacillota bacterium]